MTRKLHVAVGDTVYSIMNAGVPYEVTAVNPDGGTISVRTPGGYGFDAVDAKIFDKDPVRIMQALGDQHTRELTVLRYIADGDMTISEARDNARELIKRLNDIDMATYGRDSEDT